MTHDLSYKSKYTVIYLTVCKALPLFALKELSPCLIAWLLQRTLSHRGHAQRRLPDSGIVTARPALVTSAILKNTVTDRGQIKQIS